LSHIDLRSDTVTKPTAGMRRAMAEAEVGDDVYGEDPTVNALEAEIAELFGLAAAMYVPSGTMSNQIALRLLCPPGSELLCDADAHIVSYEAGAAAALGGIQSRTLVAERGQLDPQQLERQVRAAGFHVVPTRAIAVEQTHNRGGGSIYPLPVLRQLRELADRHELALHGDGARIVNASVASGVALGSYGELFDTLSVCLSKGLGAPVGSVLLLADADQLAAARELRHQLGGAMRQAGVIAAAGRYALAHHVERLADDHARARRLAEAAADAAPGVVDPASVETNIVLLDLPAATDARQLAQTCLDEGVLVSAVDPHRIRLVTHLDVDDASTERAAEVLRRALANLAVAA
jgi:threonine aldolase